MPARFRRARVVTSWTVLALALTAVVACGASAPVTGPDDRAASASGTEPTPTPAPTAAATGSPTAAAEPSPTERPDPRWRFYTDDVARHTSPWFTGAHRVMIGYGCNASPWYSHDARCPGRQGFHHGIDVAMPCGTPLLSAVDGTVLAPSAPGAPGSAYGVHPFRIRSGDHDLLIGHTTTVFVHPGEPVHPGQRIALAGDSGAPDGCHLHFEVRRAGGGLSTAVDPAPFLRLG